MPNSTLYIKLEFSSTSNVLGGDKVNSGMPVEIKKIKDYLAWFSLQNNDYDFFIVSLSTCRHLKEDNCRKWNSKKILMKSLLL